MASLKISISLLHCVKCNAAELKSIVSCTIPIVDHHPMRAVQVRLTLYKVEPHKALDVATEFQSNEQIHARRPTKHGENCHTTTKNT